MIAINEEQVHECLWDVGCDQAMIARFDAGSLKDKLRLLSEYRRLLLEKIHTEQKKLDHLDFLVWTVRQTTDMEERKR